MNNIKFKKRTNIKLFSLKKSLNDLFQVRRFSNILDYLRFIAICWVISNHLSSEGRLDVLNRESTALKFKKSIKENLIFGVLIGQSALGVEIFLVMSGLLASISWQKTMANGDGVKKQYLAFILKRYLRLGPVVVVFVFLVSGPLMKWLLPK